MYMFLLKAHKVFKKELGERVIKEYQPTAVYVQKKEMIN